MKSRNSGFSLVEAIVVAVIVGILAAVAIPNYIGFVRDERVNAAKSLAEAGAAAANAHWRRTGSDPATPILPNTPPLNLYFSSTDYTVTVVGTTIRVQNKKYTAVDIAVSFR